MSEELKNNIIHIFNKDLEELINERDLFQKKLETAISGINNAIEEIAPPRTNQLTAYHILNNVLNEIENIK